MSRLRALAATALTLVVCRADAREGACPEWAGPDRPRFVRPYFYQPWSEEEPIEFTGRRFDSIVYVWGRGVWFQLPSGYLQPSSRWDERRAPFDLDVYKKTLAENSSQTGFDQETGQYNPDLVKRPLVSTLGASFWIPSLRYVERNLIKTGTRTPCEAGREPPGPDEYVVTFSILWPFLPGSENSGEARRFINNAKSFEKTGRPLVNIKTHEQNIDGPISGENPYHIDHIGSNLSVLINCTAYKGDRAPPKPGCHGYSWHKQKDLIMYLRFDADRGQRGTEELWRENVDAAAKLAEMWKLEGEPNNAQ